MYKQPIFTCASQYDRLQSIKTKDNNEVLLTYQDGTTMTIRERTEEEKQKEIIKKRILLEKLNRLMSSNNVINNSSKNVYSNTSVCED